MYNVHTFQFDIFQTNFTIYYLISIEQYMRLLNYLLFNHIQFKCTYRGSFCITATLSTLKMNKLKLSSITKKCLAYVTKKLIITNY